CSSPAPATWPRLKKRCKLKSRTALRQLRSRKPILGEAGQAGHQSSACPSFFKPHSVARRPDGGDGGKVWAGALVSGAGAGADEDEPGAPVASLAAEQIAHGRRIRG